MFIRMWKQPFAPLKCKRPYSGVAYFRLNCQAQAWLGQAIVEVERLCEVAKLHMLSSGIKLFVCHIVSRK